MKIVKQALNVQQPSMDIEGVPAWLGDTLVSDDKEHTICAGFFRLEKGNSLEYTYDYDEMKYVAAGEFDITYSSGQTVHATVRDVLYFANGDSVKFETASFGVGFFTGLRQPI